MGFIFGGGSRINSGSPPATSLRIQSSVQGQPISFVHGQNRIAGNLIWYGDFSYYSGSGSGKGGKGGIVGGGGKAGTGAGANYSASFAEALCEGPVDAVLQVWNNKTPQSLSSIGFSVFDGYQGQPPWGYLTGNPYAIGYSSLAYVGVGSYNLGNQPELPNFNFEVRGAISGAVSETYTISGGLTFTPTYWNLSNSTIELVAIPATPYQYQAQNSGAITALPVVNGAITSADVCGSSSSGVVDTAGNVYTLVGSSPTAGQYSVTAGGLYTFAAADAGVEVNIVDLAVSPGVSYIYQPTATFSSGVTSFTVSSASNLAAGQLITGAGIAAGTVATNVSGTTVTISQATTAAESGTTLTFWGAALTQVLSAAGDLPLQGQFSVSVAAGAYGQYLFSAADSGSTVGILDIVDADPSLSLTDYLTNPRYGIGFPAAQLGSLTGLQNWTFANGLFISPAFTQQQSGQQFFNDFSTGLNGEFVWSTGLLTWVPYGDTTVSGYGKTYTATSSPIYSLDDDDFLKNEGTSSVGVSAFSSEDPVVCVRKRPSDAYNDVKVEYLDRGNSYNPAIVEAQDDAAINTFGLRPADTKTLHFFCGSQAALTSAQLQLGRQMVRNQYTFTVPWYYILLDPMDIIEITDSNLGITNQWVRILEITENQQDSTLTITAEEYLTGSGSTPLFGTQVKAGYAPNYNIAPGQAIAPIVFEAPVQIATNSGLETWLVTGGGTNWGGCDVYLSTDNLTYRLAGRYYGSSRIGVNNTDFPSHTDPDTTDTLQVVLSAGGELYSATSTADADAGHTLCYEGGYPNPPAPTLSSSAGGSIALTEYFTRTTYVFAGGEGPPSPEDSLEVLANNLLVVGSPVAQTGATGWNVYVSTSTGAETKQNSGAIAIGTAWTEPTSGLTAGGSPPNSETSYELVSYETANLVSGAEYNLGSYIRRGQYNTTISDHPVGSQFARLDGSQMAIPYDKSQIGTTIYIKLLSFNQWGGGEISLADVQPFTHVIEGPPLLAQVQGFSATQSGNAVAFGWTDLAYEGGLKGYDILYGPESGSVATAILLTEAARGTEMTNAGVPPGTWTFYIRGHDIADQLGPTSSVNLIVTNNDSIIATAEQEPAWPGTSNGRLLLNNGGTLLLNSGQGQLLLNNYATFYTHYTGILIPMDQNLAGYYATLSVPSAPTTSTVSGGALGLKTYYVKITYVDAFGETTVSNESTQIVPALSLLVVDSPSATSSSNQPATGWNVYVGTSSGAETKQNTMLIPIGSNWTEPTTGLISGAAAPTVNGTGWALFDAMVPTPVPTATYIAPTIDTGYNDSVRVYSSMVSTLGAAGESGAVADLGLSIDTWLSGATDPDTYIPWTIGFVDCRYVNAMLTYSNITAGNVSYITDFTVTVDTSPQIENSSSGGVSVIATIATTGTTNGTTTVSGIASMTGIAIGQGITGANIPLGTTVLTVNVGGSSLTMSAAATGSASGQAIDFNTWVTFTTPYHFAPDVVVTPVSAASAYGTATNISQTGFSPIIWNGGSSIAGTANWQSTGS